MLVSVNIHAFIIGYAPVSDWSAGLELALNQLICSQDPVVVVPGGVVGGNEEVCTLSRCQSY